MTEPDRLVASMSFEVDELEDVYTQRAQLIGTAEVDKIDEIGRAHV